MPNNNEIFLQFWKTFKWPEPQPLWFRLYHDEQGKPICYSRHELAGQYLEITPEEFALGRMDVLVCDGKIVYPDPPPPPKLVPADHGTPCHPHDVTVIVDAETKDVQYWRMNSANR
jgi:hypothetical protein